MEYGSAGGCRALAILAGSAALPLIFQFLTEQFFVNKCKDNTLQCNEMSSDRYRMEDLEVATQLKSVLSCTAERSTISAVCNFCTDNVNEEQLHRKIQQ